MTFEQANSIVNQTDNRDLNEEAKSEFGIVYEQPLCTICKRKRICKMVSPFVYRCRFVDPD